jgi:hypothetical protein
MGVPYYQDETDYYIDGFEIDSLGNYFFCGGDSAMLVKYTPDKKIVFRKKYHEFQAGQIYLRQNSVYLFDNKFEKNGLFVVNTTSGEIVDSVPHVIKNRINSFLFSDSFLIAEVFDYQKRIDMTTKRCFVKFDVAGKLVGQVPNRYNMPLEMYPARYEENAVQYLGRWKGACVYWGYDPEKGLYKFWLGNDSGEIFARANFQKAITGKVYYGNPNEHRKLRNDKIYILGRKDKNALITTIPLEELFTSQVPCTK